MASVEQICVKRGDTVDFIATGTLLPDGVNWRAVSQVRLPGGRLVGSFAATVQPPVAPAANPSSARLQASSVETASWPVGNLLSDVRFVDGSTPPVVHTFPTFLIRVQRSKSDG